MATEERVESATIENLLREERTFPPHQEFVGNALLSDPSVYQKADTEEGFRAFWTQAAERIDWIKPWDELYTWDLPYAKWFLGCNLNISVN